MPDKAAGTNERIIMYKLKSKCCNAQTIIKEGKHFCSKCNKKCKTFVLDKNITIEDLPQPEGA